MGLPGEYPITSGISFPGRNVAKSKYDTIPFETLNVARDTGFEQFRAPSPTSGNKSIPSNSAVFNYRIERNISARQTEKQDIYDYEST